MGGFAQSEALSKRNSTAVAVDTLRTLHWRIGVMQLLRQPDGSIVLVVNTAYYTTHAGRRQGVDNWGLASGHRIN
jgi:hypothetical protein